MMAYSYDGATGEFIGEDDARVCPGREQWSDDDPGKFLVPAHATTMAPPQEQTGFARVFSNGEWSLVEDHRGETFYDANGAQVTIATLGPVPAELLAEPPVSVIVAEITRFRDARLAAGFNDVGETGKSYQCDQSAVTNWTALASAAGFALASGAAPLPTFTLIAADNSTIELDAHDLFALMTDRVMPWVSATYLHARSLKDQVLAGNPPAEITAGWP